MIETLEHPHLTPYALGLQCNLARDVPRRRLGGEISRVHEGKRVTGES